MSKWLSMLRIHLKKDNTCPRRTNRFCQGFTLVELMISIFIVGTLIAIAVPVATDYYYKARVVRAMADIRVIEKEIVAYKIDVDTYPNSLADIGWDNHLDPWGNPYKYLNIEGL